MKFIESWELFTFESCFHLECEAAVGAQLVPAPGIKELKGFWSFAVVWSLLQSDTDPTKESEDQMDF